VCVSSRRLGPMRKIISILKPGHGMRGLSGNISDEKLEVLSLEFFRKSVLLFLDNFVGMNIDSGF
jgi:hypothetical protein